mgnify:CR=1 FL=1
MTTFQVNQLAAIKAETKEAQSAFHSTGATAKLGVVSNYSGAYTVNTLQGEKKPTSENAQFESEVAAVVSFAKQYGAGSLKKAGNGTYLVFAA